MNTEITFEEALSKLETIVKQLEGGEATLEESLHLFEDGIELSGLCSNLLKSAKQKVEILIETSDGIKKEDFTANE